MEEFQWLSLTGPDEWIPYPQLDPNNDESWNCNVDYTISNIYQQVSKKVVISSLKQKPKENNLSPERLSKLWRIDLNKAKNTLNVTTHKSIHFNEGRMSQRFRTDLYQRRYKILGGPYSRFYTDTLFFKVKSTLGFTCG